MINSNGAKMSDPVIDEMISKINIPLIKRLFALGTQRRASLDELDEGLFMEYIYEWARNKKWIYQMFGNNLSISKSVQVDKAPHEIRDLVYGLSENFPISKFHFDIFSTDEISQNKILEDKPYYTNMGVACKKGMRLTKFLSGLLQDELFDIELSKVFQNKKIDKDIVISIDPLDFLTMSIHKYKWVSCYNISNGCYSNCAFSLMRDEISTICFACGKMLRTYTFGLKGESFDFSWNSKQLRSVLCIEKTTKSFFIFRAQGSADNLFYDTASEILKEKISLYDPKTEYKESSYGGNFRIEPEKYSHLYTDEVESYIAKNVGDRDLISLKIGVQKNLISPFSKRPIVTRSVLF